MFTAGGRTVDLGAALVATPGPLERPFSTADSIGRCNTLSAQHCSAKMYLNQRNSQRFKGTPGPIAGTTGSLIPVTAPIAC